VEYVDGIFGSQQHLIRQLGSAKSKEIRVQLVLMGCRSAMRSALINLERRARSDLRCQGARMRERHDLTVTATAALTKLMTDSLLLS
jgi:hypothetical protein